MHELGIVFHIIRTVEDVAKENHVARIQRVTLQLGEVSGVVEATCRTAGNGPPPNQRFCPVPR